MQLHDNGGGGPEDGIAGRGAGAAGWAEGGVKRRWIVPVGDTGRVELSMFGDNGGVSFTVSDCTDSPLDEFTVELTTHEREELILALQQAGEQHG